MSYPIPAREERPRFQVVAGEGITLEGEWASDHWNAQRLGIWTRRGRGAARFDGIGQKWLRDSVKAWSRFRLGPGPRSRPSVPRRSR